MPHFNRLEPTVDAPPPPRLVAERPIFTTDAPAQGDALGQDGAVRLISELTCHSRTELPLVIAALGGPGAGQAIEDDRASGGKGAGKVAQSRQRHVDGTGNMPLPPFAGISRHLRAKKSRPEIIASQMSIQRSSG